jgi:hypothetical protein
MERADSEALSEQTASAYEVQAAELAAAQAEVEVLKGQVERLEEALVEKLRIVVSMSLAPLGANGKPTDIITWRRQITRYVMA